LPHTGTNPPRVDVFCGEARNAINQAYRSWSESDAFEKDLSRSFHPISERSMSSDDVNNYSKLVMRLSSAMVRSLAEIQDESKPRPARKPKRGRKRPAK